MQFIAVRDAYHDVTHRKGYVCVTDSMVLRSTRDKIKCSKKLFNQFQQVAKFHVDDMNDVWTKYNERFETLIGNEVASQYMEDLQRSKNGTLEQLRLVKQKQNSTIKYQKKISKVDTSHVSTSDLDPDPKSMSTPKSDPKSTPDPTPTPSNLEPVHESASQSTPAPKRKRGTRKRKRCNKDVCTVCYTRVLNENIGGEIACDMCDQWLHLRCLKKSERWARALKYFFCDSCKKSSLLGFGPDS